MWLVYKKELLEILRDKKTLIFSILLPTVIFPVLFFGIGAFVDSKETEAKNKEIKVTFINGDTFEGFTELFTAEKLFKKVTIESKDYKEEILNNNTDFIIEIPEGASMPSDSSRQEVINLYYKGSSKLDNISRGRVNDVIELYNNTQRLALGDKFNLSTDNVKAFNNPIDVENKNFASERERLGEFAGPLIAYILIALAVSGAMYPALELGVGEKERGTLETLLLTPMSKGRIVLAKFAVIFTASFFTVVVTLLSYFIWTYIFTLWFNMGGLGFLSNISGLDLLLVAVLLVPLTSIFASIMLSASIYAKNMKEAQAYMSPIFMLGFMPVIVAFVPGMELNVKTAMIPITNVALAMKDLIKGTVDYGMIGVLLASTLVIAGAMLYFTTQFFKKEKVLFRS
ncbi:ABC transporter permease [Kangiella sediminilitoris]|uniref:ABC-type Na+ efflux pump, permease component n=1 Tax=Kangiella sediminilitoris TaxID=1144748 RepID=A0A1B3B986_9GAMM|nr:ABC transporter permease [Kangiella sediminilitoris]AOE49364.1 ABC-type Na+ efflux pump, permease component [Kangiella sediminilitoris]